MLPAGTGSEPVEELVEKPVEPQPLRIWLEPGYDGGRVAAWMLDLPVLAHAATRERALSAGLSAAGRFREWLEGHGDDAGLPPFRWATVVEEVPSVVVDGGAELKATFAAERRAVDGAETERVVRRLAWAREDLAVVVGRVRTWTAAHGDLPGTDADREARDPDAVLRHLAAAEVRLATRMDAAAAYPGALGRDPLDDELAATRAWAVERLRELAGRVGADEVADERGETWTLAKVLRRMACHAIDHLWELDRRLARVDGTASRVVVTLDRRPSITSVVPLLRSAGWDLDVEPPEPMAAAIAATTELATAWDGDRLVGIARSLTDGARNAFISTVVVHPRWQSLGVGERLMAALMDGRPGIRFALSAASGMDAWYAKLGFVPDPHAMVRRRAR